jgi:two-component system, NtrC family, sensor kinase
MSLRTKIELILFIIFILYGSFTYTIQKIIIYPSFVSLEQSEAIKNMTRCQETLKKEIYHLDLLCNDWASWDDTYKFMEDRNEDYLKTNISTETFYNNNLSVIALCDTKGKIAWAGMYNAQTKSIEIMQNIPKELLVENKLDIFYDPGQNPLAGFILTDKGPMLISSRPILTTENKGPGMGTFIFARRFDEVFIKTLSEQTQLAIKFHLIQNQPNIDKFKEIINNISQSSPNYINEKGKEILETYSILNDLYKKPIFLIQVNLHRKITEQGLIATHFSILAIIGFGFLTLLAILILLKINVVNPINNLKEHALSIGKKDSIHEHIPINREDEIGLLSIEFNRMIEKLSEAREKLMDQSFHSGESEIVANILHNVRNSLNPITTHLDSLLKELMIANFDNIKRAQKELLDPEVPIERKRDLIQYIELSLNKISDQQNSMREKVNDVINRLFQFEIILNNEEKHSHIKPPIEWIKLNKLIHDAISSLSENLRHGISFEIDPDIQNMPIIKVPRLLLSKVISNLFTNSIFSIKETGISDGKIIISTFEEILEKNRMIHIKIKDNRMGIESECLNRIFERDLTQKVRSGEGLHWCANTIINMNGSIYAEKDKSNQGVSFHILIPLSQDK